MQIRRGYTGFAFAMVLLIAGCQPDNGMGRQSTVFALSENSCHGADEDWYFPIVKGQQCGKLPVRENPEDPSSPLIELNILRLPSVSANPANDPLFIIVGGPGQAAVSLAEELSPIFADVRKQRDIIFVDQRGTGQSSPLDCGEMPVGDSQLDSDQYQQQLLKQLQACAQQYVEHIPFYTTPYAIRDLEAVRVALGYDKVNLWGVSYGTRVALSYLRDYPQQVRTAILDGVAPSGMNLIESFAVDGQRAVQLLSTQCASLDECARRYGSLSEKYDKLISRFDDTSFSVAASHPRTGLRQSVIIDKDKFEGLVRMALYSRDIARLLPFFVHEAFEQRYEPLAGMLILMNEQDFAGISYGMHYTVTCNEDYRQSPPDSPNTMMERFFAETCAFWPASQLPENYYEPVTADVPVLILSGELDPVTPPRWGDEVARHLPRSLHLVAAGGHHSVSRDGCIPQLMTRFIQTGSERDITADCVEKIKTFYPYLSSGENELQRSPASEKDNQP